MFYIAKWKRSLYCNYLSTIKGKSTKFLQRDDNRKKYTSPDLIKTVQYVKKHVVKYVIFCLFL